MFPAWQSQHNHVNMLKSKLRAIWLRRQSEQEKLAAPPLLQSQSLDQRAFLTRLPSLVVYFVTGAFTATTTYFVLLTKLASYCQQKCLIKSITLRPVTEMIIDSVWLDQQSNLAVTWLTSILHLKSLLGPHRACFSKSHYRVRNNHINIITCCAAHDRLFPRWFWLPVTSRDTASTGGV